MRTFIIPAAIVLAISAVAVYAAEVRLTDDEKAECEEGGGCVIIPRASLAGLVKQAHERGAASCGKGV